MTFNILGRSRSSNPSLIEQRSRTLADCTDAVKLSEKLSEDFFTFSLKLSHFKGIPLLNLNKIEIAMWESEMDGATHIYYFPYRRPIAVEVYAEKGVPFAESPLICIL